MIKGNEPILKLAIWAIIHKINLTQEALWVPVGLESTEEIVIPFIEYLLVIQINLLCYVDTVNVLKSGEETKISVFNFKMFSVDVQNDLTNNSFIMEMRNTWSFIGYSFLISTWNSWDMYFSFLSNWVK